MPIYPTPEQIETLMKGPADTPVVMVNLLRFKAEADGDDRGASGDEAYGRYAVEMRKVVESYGGRFIWSGRVDSLVIADGDERFDVIALVEYPSREVFLKVTRDPRVAEIGAHRAAGLESQWLIATTAGGTLGR